MRHIEDYTRHNDRAYQYPSLFHPIRPICDPEWITLSRFNAVGALVNSDIGKIQAALGKAAEKGGVLNPREGVLAAVLYWDGSDGYVAGYEPKKGIQVGYGHIYWNRQKQWKERKRRMGTFTPEYFVAEQFTHGGIGRAMAQLLEDYIAVNTDAVGARILSTIEAKTPIHHEAMHRILMRLGAREIQMKGRAYYERIVLQSDQFSCIGTQDLPYIESSVANIDDMVRRYKEITGSVYTNPASR